jgi:hypothetical protein
MKAMRIHVAIWAMAFRMPNSRSYSTSRCGQHDARHGDGQESHGHAHLAGMTNEAPESFAKG